MIEVKSRTHTIRLFADGIRRSDLFKLVLYCGYRGDPKRIPFYYTRHKGESCSTDLTLPMDEILALMKSNTRNEIRRAEREGCEFALVNSFAEFVPYYNGFCKDKGLNDYTSEARMGKYEKVLMTKVVHSGEVLAMHANILDEKSKTALLLYSCSRRLSENVDRKLIGWGNRYLHFKDLEYLKSAGYERYDWSGVCTDPNDPRFSIGQFKLSFGGVLIDSWTVKSPLYAKMEIVRNWLGRIRHRG